MRFIAIALIVVCLMGLALPMWAQTTDNADKAKEYYVAGEKAYNAGKLEVAIALWNKALELKPDSDFTKKSVAKAKDELYKRTIDFCNGPGVKDPVSAFINLVSVKSLLPEKTDLSQRAQTILDKFTEDQKKAVIQYQEAIKQANAKNYDKAAQNAALAKIYAPESVAVTKLVNTIKDLQARESSAPGGSTAAAPSLESNAPSTTTTTTKTESESKAPGINNGKPSLIIFYADWCSSSEKMSPMFKEIQDQYRDKLNVLFVDLDVEQNREFLKKSPIQGIPLQVIYDKNEKEVFTHLGEITKEQLVAEINKVLGN